MRDACGPDLLLGRTNGRRAQTPGPSVLVITWGAEWPPTRPGEACRAGCCIRHEQCALGWGAGGDSGGHAPCPSPVRGPRDRPGCWDHRPQAAPPRHPLPSGVRGAPALSVPLPAARTAASLRVPPPPVLQSFLKCSGTASWKGRTAGSTERRVLVPNAALCSRGRSISSPILLF